MVHLKLEPYIKKQILIAACLNTGHLFLGFGISWSAPMVPKLMDPDQTPLPYTISASQASLVGSLMFIGSIASFWIGHISNRIGRRPTIVIGDLFTLFAYILINWPANLAMIYAGRIIAGFGMSFVAILNMVYIGEISPPNIRGIILTSTGVFHGLGSLLALSVGPYLPYSRFGYIVITIILIHLVGTLCIPESPVYYVIKGDEKAARRVLERLGRVKDIDIELKTMMTHVQEQQNTGKITELFTDKTNRKAFIICLVLVLIQQANGMIAVMFIVTTIFEQAGSYMRADISSIIVGFTSLCGTIVAPLFIERCGRKVLLIISTGGCFLAMISLGIYFYLVSIEHSSINVIGWLPLVSLIISLFTFNIGLGIIPNTIVGEMFRANFRSVGSSTTMAIGWVFGFIVSTLFGYIVFALGSYITFFMCAVVNGVGTWFTIFYVPETKGKTLVEIEHMLDR